MSPAQFISSFSDADVNQLALQREHYKELTDAEWRHCLQQIDGRQRMKSKLPEIAADSEWLFPPRLNLEQCSSEQTAKYKRQLISRLGIHTLIDLTGGFGIDCHYMSQAAQTTHYVERDEYLCQLMQHNSHTANTNITVHNTTAELFLSAADNALFSSPDTTLIYADPARRSALGNKVYRLEDCEPNIVPLIQQIQRLSRYQMYKLSPMLDITAAWRALQQTGQTNVVAVGGEVKEVLLITATKAEIIAIDLLSDLHFCFTREEEEQATYQHSEHILNYLYEPHAALLKAGADKLICQRYNLQKIDNNTHIYTSSRQEDAFPGRIFRTTEHKPLKGEKYHVISRNYPLSANALQQKLRLKEGGERYVIGLRVNGRSQTVVCERVK